MTQNQTIKASEDQYRSKVTPDILDFPGSIFYHSDFLTTASKILNLKFQPLLCISNEELTGIANTFTANRFNVKTAFIPNLFQYYGPITLKPDERIFEYIDEAIKTEADAAIFSLTPEECLKSSHPGWQKQDRLTYYLIPGNFENMKSRCSGDVKNKINKAIKADVKVMQSDKFPYEIYNSSFERKGMKPPVERQKIINWVEKMMELHLAETFLAVVDDKPVAFRTELILGKYAYDWLAGAIIKYSSIGVNQMLVLKIGDTLYHKGIKSWDLLGGDIKSIGDFKKSFGSISKKHVQLEKCFNLKGKIYHKLMKMKAGFNA